MSFLTWIPIILSIIKGIGELIKIAEKAFDGIPDSGAQKKAMVMEAVHTIVDSLDDLTLTPEIWARIESIVSPFIDMLCSFVFKSNKKETVK
jgi:hypothetical protein